MAPPNSSNDLCILFYGGSVSAENQDDYREQETSSFGLFEAETK